MKILKRVFFSGLVLFVLLIGAGYVLLAFPFQQPPEIGRDLPDNFDEADVEFKRRVAAEFKMPIPENEFASRLQAQGFKVDLKNSYAIYEKPDFVCTLIWMLSWKTVDKLVVDINATHGGRCL